jgi:hypothetical protein
MSGAAQIRFVASDPKIDLSVDIGNLIPTPVAGLGGYEEIERQDDVNATNWTGQDAYREDISILFDGYDDGNPVDRQINTLLKLARDPNGERVPPIFKVFGPVRYPGKSWVLPVGGLDFEGGEIAPITRKGGAETLRQEVIVHLLEWNPLGHKKKRTPKHQRGEPGKTGGTAYPGHSYTVQKGDTLHSIAARLYGDASEWEALGAKNDIKDPSKKLKPGLLLKLP